DPRLHAGRRDVDVHRVGVRGAPRLSRRRRRLPGPSRGQGRADLRGRVDARVRPGAGAQRAAVRAQRRHRVARAADHRADHRRVRPARRARAPAGQGLTVSRRTLGPLALMLGLPPLTYYFWRCLSEYGGALVAPSLRELIARVPAPTPRALAVYGGWLVLQVALQLWVPGRVQSGVPLADGSRLDYRLNGWISFWISVAVAVVAVVSGVIPATVAYDEFGPLPTTAHLVAFGLALGLYVQGRRGGRTIGDPIYDYFMGTTLNPRLGALDLKYFCESRPGLILWVLLNLSFAAAQYQRHGTVTTAMLLVNAFQFLYVADYFFHEEAILSTWDIKHEKFGWMLAWGDLVWVPFTYTIQAYYLVDHPHALSPAATVGIV